MPTQDDSVDTADYGNTPLTTSRGMLTHATKPSKPELQHRTKKIEVYVQRECSMNTQDDIKNIDDEDGAHEFTTKIHKKSKYVKTHYSQNVVLSKNASSLKYAFVIQFVLVRNYKKHS